VFVLKGRSAKERAHSVSVVIPVYKGEHSLPALMAEIAPLTALGETPAGRAFIVTEVILVHDNGPDDSDAIMRELSSAYPFVSTLWLSRNFGQHAATLAGMSASKGEWIVTLDEDGQHDPAHIPELLDVAVEQRASLVYAKPTNVAPHGLLRNAASRTAKRIISHIVGGKASQEFQSYRLVRGDIGRQLAGFAVSGVYLDVALGWVTDRVATVPIELRDEGDRESGYSYSSLFAHFWRMVLSSGTRGLRLVSVIGVTLAFLGVVLAIYLIIGRLSGSVSIEGWTSLAVITLICSGAILVSLGIIAEYIGVTLNVAMGRPLYLLVDDPVRVLPLPDDENLPGDDKDRK
jgi:undecaprenyl-phosphate 4-deoxy-4-formamido-L-arabinose transferase